MMKLYPAQHECAQCHKTLKWWNEQTCTRCGRKMCDQHGHQVRCSAHSTVLFVVCDGCTGRHEQQAQRSVAQRRQKGANI